MAGFGAAGWVALFAVGFFFAWLGRVAGCELNEGGTHPCLVLGVDVGVPLYMASVAPLLLAAFGSVLFVLGILFCLVVALFVWMFTHRRYADW